MPVHAYDTSAGRVVPTSPGRQARMYVCGITPYDATHLGHAATYVAFDLLNRAWLDAGHEVAYVQNVTDIDDPLFDRAAATGERWDEVARRETEQFRDDMLALRVLPPQHYVGAVEAMPKIVELIARLREKGAAYDVDGDLYFPVASDPGFGAVSRFSPDEMLAAFAERGGDPDRPGKKDVLDCLLWRAARPGKPSWPAPFGPGRPGWHVECAAIALDLLGNHIDVQGGGSDLVFPHHEMGASHAHLATGEPPFAKAYVHAGMVGLEGAKMSKSAGNLVFVRTLRHAGADPMAIRLALLDHHYRDDWEWTPGLLAAAEERLTRWREAVRLDAGVDGEALVQQVRAALADDLDAPAALAAVDAWAGASSVVAGDDADAPALVARVCDALLGVRLSAP
jgi:L-cysteine:1D-myo-inositol 2-amino-2-deoxy-alpha-D-glucopyranoside ligase